MEDRDDDRAPARRRRRRWRGDSGWTTHDRGWLHLARGEAIGTAGASAGREPAAGCPHGREQDYGQGGRPAGQPESCCTRRAICLVAVILSRTVSSRPHRVT
jgi:hypothetical protein